MGLKDFVVVAVLQQICWANLLSTKKCSLCSQSWKDLMTMDYVVTETSSRNKEVTLELVTAGDMSWTD